MLTTPRPVADSVIVAARVPSETGMFCTAIAKIGMPWPPLALVTLHKLTEGATELELFAGSDGRLGFFQKDADGSQFFVFQPVFFSAEGASFLMFGMAEDGPMMEIRGTRLLLDQIGEAPPVYFDMSTVTGQASFLWLDPARGADEDEEFFLHTLNDLNAKATAGTKYELLRAAGILRQLLLDGLIDRVNKRYRKQIRYVILEPGFEAAFADVATYWQSLDPSPFPGSRTVELKADAFLKARIFFWQGQRATVKDIIKTCANAKGGVHLGDADNSQEQLVIDFDTLFTGVATGRSLTAIRGLCRIVLQALRPLAESMMAPT
jgi:hypothetical protein